MKYLGIDYGTKRIGVALSDESGSLAFPLTTIDAGREALNEITALAAKEGIQKIILGESRKLSGEPNPLMEDIEQFKNDVHELTKLPVEYEQEFFTSALASRQYEDRTQPRRPERVGAPTKASGERLDASAAAVILQSFLDRMKNHGAN